jgi:hypothetical protein
MQNIRKVVGLIKKSERYAELVEIDDTSTITLDREITSRS